MFNFILFYLDDAFTLYVYIFFAPSNMDTSNIFDFCKFSVAFKTLRIPFWHVCGENDASSIMSKNTHVILFTYIYNVICKLLNCIFDWIEKKYNLQMTQYSRKCIWSFWEIIHFKGLSLRIMSLLMQTSIRFVAIFCI